MVVVVSATVEVVGAMVVVSSCVDVVHGTVVEADVVGPTVGIT